MLRAVLAACLLATALAGCAGDSDTQSIDGDSTTPRPWSPDPAWGNPGNSTGNGTMSQSHTSSYPSR